MLGTEAHKGSLSHIQCVVQHQLSICMIAASPADMISFLYVSLFFLVWTLVECFLHHYHQKTFSLLLFLHQLTQIPFPNSHNFLQHLLPLFLVLQTHDHPFLVFQDC
ncbi:hypothetical protein V8G54_004539 [Vigna mungo]|uniref:Uncharacterized protein n=1 Tax=Vigna mungo TaxID=3915 RepID=A0AAQ3PCI8_VIGMU